MEQPGAECRSAPDPSEMDIAGHIVVEAQVTYRYRPVTIAGWTRTAGPRPPRSTCPVSLTRLEIPNRATADKARKVLKSCGSPPDIEEWNIPGPSNLAHSYYRRVISISIHLIDQPLRHIRAATSGDDRNLFWGKCELALKLDDYASIPSPITNAVIGHDKLAECLHPPKGNP
jgi:hypothetical protein